MRRCAAAMLLMCLLGFLGLVGTATHRTRLVEPSVTVQLRDRTGQFLGEVHADPDETRLGFWPLSEVPERVVLATLVLEDRRFFTHPGVDVRAVARALRQNLLAGHRVSGASTIAMQVARLQDPGNRTVTRKATEALTALMLTERYEREVLLAQYLTLAPYGNNVHGIGYAARRYFDKPVADLSWAEIAMLTAIPQAPGARNLYHPAGRAAAIERGERILDRLLADGHLDEGSHAAALVELTALKPLYRPARPHETLHAVLAYEVVDAASPLVRTSIDLDLQQQVQRHLANAVDAYEERGAKNAAAVVVDLQTMQVLVDVGSVGFLQADRSGAIDYTRTSRTPGSTLKPFLYAHAIDRGIITPSTVMEDLLRGPDGIGNADGRFLGPLLPRQALANSRNVPTISLAKAITLDGVYSLFAGLGLHDHEVSASHYGLGVAIGGMPTDPLSLARAWAALATDGRLRPLNWHADAEADPGVPVFSPEAAAWTALALSDPMARLPTFPRMGHTELPFAAAFKTGTSPDFRDAWTVAFSDRYLVVVWVGHPDWRPMSGLSGYRGASHLAAKLLAMLHPEAALGLQDRPFPAPAGWTAATVCPMSGALAGPQCTGAFDEWFAPAQAPATLCAVHRMQHTAEGHRLVVDLPPQFSAWQSQQPGLPRPQMAASDRAVKLSVLSPADGLSLGRDPDAPPDRSTLLLRVAVDPPVDEVVWYVDGEPYAVVDAPYEVRWPISPGPHAFEARLPYRPERTEAVQVHVF